MKRHRGYALYVALVLVGLAGLLIAATMSLLKTDVRRTSAEVTTTQLRQLLLAGQSSAAEELRRTGRLQDRPLRLPPELAEASLAIRVDRSTADRVEARIQAKVLETSLEQSLVYVRQADRWTLASASLP